jgi:hypothetical protein
MVHEVALCLPGTRSGCDWLRRCNTTADVADGDNHSYDDSDSDGHADRDRDHHNYGDRDGSTIHSVSET